MNDRIHIFSGHFGSGKTEVALNFAIAQAEMRKKVIIVDLDTVNPYFRTNDAKDIMTEKGIRVIASEFAGTNIDMPTVPTDILSVFEEKDATVIFDVGGDEDGAYALGQYKRFFEKENYRMYLVVNTKRPLTKNEAELSEMMAEIENASRLKFTDIINNTNLSYMTDENTLLSDYDDIKKLSDKCGLPVSMHTGTEKALSNLPDGINGVNINIYIKKPWE